MEHTQVDELITEVKHLHKHASHMRNVISCAREINESALEIANTAVTLAPLGLLDSRIHTAIETILSNTKTIQHKLLALAEDIEGTGEYWSTRVAEINNLMKSDKLPPGTPDPRD